MERMQSMSLSRPYAQKDDQAKSAPQVVMVYAEVSSAVKLRLERMATQVRKFLSCVLEAARVLAIVLLLKLAMRQCIAVLQL